MAGNEKDEKQTKTLEDIERQVDAMENAEAGGEGGTPFAGPSDDDVEIVVAPEGDDGEPINLDRLDAGQDPNDELVVDGEQPAEEKHGTEDDDGVAGYSERVRARIRRADNLRKSAEDREESERTARIQAQSEAHSAQLNAAEITLAMVEGSIKDKEAALKIAKDGGKVDDDIKITGELSELRARKTEVERVKEHLKTSKPAVPNPLVHAWERQNRWYGNAEFMAESAAVRTISQQIAQKFPPNTQEHFEEVDRQLKQRMPNLAARVKARLGQDAIRWDARANGAQPRGEPQAQRRQAPRLASPGGGFGKPASSGGKRQIVMTRADFDAMRAVRLDPNKRSDVLNYAREKAALAAQK